MALVPVVAPANGIESMTGNALTALKPALNIAINVVPLMLATRSAPVITYHACFPECPSEVDPVDNVTPDQLYSQVAELKRHCTLVSIDELASASNRRGLAAITFDDGYRSVLEHALPVLESLEAPFTIFVNTASLEQKIFWRRKVVHIIANDLVAACEQSFVKTRPVEGETFHSYLKSPLNHSGVADREIDCFLAQRGITLHPLNYHIGSINEMFHHRLVSWGNHSHNHYVLSSLTGNEQREEIDRTKRVLAQSPGRPSAVFSLPFGETRHFNEQTCAALRECGYSVLLMNRGGLNTGALKRKYGLIVIERFSPFEHNFQRQLRIHFCRSAIVSS